MDVLNDYGILKPHPTPWH